MGIIINYNLVGVSSVNHFMIALKRGPKMGIIINYNLVGVSSVNHFMIALKRGPKSINY
jgi:hypothetical protein